MRLLVVAGSWPPNSSTLPSSKRSRAPQPPGPGFPLQAPSVAAATTRPRPSAIAPPQLISIQRGFTQSTDAANLPPQPQHGCCDRMHRRRDAGGSIRPRPVRQQSGPAEPFCCARSAGGSEQLEVVGAGADQATTPLLDTESRRPGGPDPEHIQFCRNLQPLSR